jgi:hypothetical protein
MPVTFSRRGTKFVAEIICDSCGQPIEDAWQGIATFPCSDQDGPLTTRFLHKGKKCDPGCPPHLPGDPTEGWFELSVVVVWLAHGLGMSYKEFVSAEERAQWLEGM